MDRDCRNPPSPTLRAGVRQFNSGEYFACHETLEDLWLAEPGPQRRLYQGILQVAVGLLHLQRGNAAGAESLLDRGSALLEPFLPVCLELDIATLVAGAREVLAALRKEGLETTRDRQSSLFPRLRFLQE